MKERAAARRPAGRAAQGEGKGEWGERAALALLWCLAGLLMPRAVLYGQMAPCGVGLTAAAGEWTLPVAAAVAAGYLLAGQVVLPLRYIAAAALVAATRWVLAAVPELRERPFVPPLLAFVSTTATGLLILGQTGLDVWRVLLILAEGAVAAGCAVFFGVAVAWSRDCLAAMHSTQSRPLLTPGQQAALILTGAVAIMAASTVTVREFSPGRMVAVLLVLVLARSGREAGGCMAGVIMGAAVAVAAPGQTVLAIAMAFGGLIAGVFSRFGRVVEALTFFVAAGVVTLAETDSAALIHLYEIAGGGLLLVLLPKSWDRRLGHLFIRSRDLPAVEGMRRAMTMRLEVAAQALEDVADTVGVVSERLARHGAQDTAALLRDCRSAVCAGCPLQQLCWEQHREEMLAALEATVPLLRQQAAVAADQLTGWPAQHCCQPQQLADTLSTGYAAMVAREGAWRRLEELQVSLQQQLGGTGALLTDIAGELQQPGQVDTELSGRVLAVCRDHGMPVQDALCTRSRGSRLTVEILTQDVGVRLDGGRWLREIREACGRDFAPPAVAECGRQLRVTLTECPRYSVEIGRAQLCCGGEKLCGDAAEHFSQRGQTVVLLSDGMGSGGRAAVDGAMAAGLATRLWRAGFSPDSILQTVNAALLVKSREESLATLDVAVVDEFSGRLDNFKAGAAASLLRSGERVSRIERPGLPLGILPQVSFEHSHDWLADGDILLLVSDGALSGGMAALEALLRRHPAGDSMQALADAVVAAARAAQTEHQDDITAVALRLHRR